MRALHIVSLFLFNFLFMHSSALFWLDILDAAAHSLSFFISTTCQAWSHVELCFIKECLPEGAWDSMNTMLGRKKCKTISHHQVVLHSVSIVPVSLEMGAHLLLFCKTTSQLGRIFLWFCSINFYLNFRSCIASVHFQIVSLLIPLRHLWIGFKISI